MKTQIRFLKNEKWIRFHCAYSVVGALRISSQFKAIQIFLYAAFNTGGHCKSLYRPTKQMKINIKEKKMLANIW